MCLQNLRRGNLNAQKVNDTLEFSHDLLLFQIGADGRVVDTPEVSLAKAEHAAAHINEKVTLNNEALRSADYLVAAPAAALPVAHAAPVFAAGPAILASPYAAQAGVIGLDGRPLDTAEVAIAKAAHAAAHINDRLIQAQEANRNAFYY